MATIGEEIQKWKDEYNNGDVIHKYIMHTVLLMEKFKIEQEYEWLKTQPEITREEYLKALGQEE